MKRLGYAQVVTLIDNVRFDGDRSGITVRGIEFQQ